MDQLDGCANLGWLGSLAVGWQGAAWYRMDSPGCTHLCSITSHPAVLFSLREAGVQRDRETLQKDLGLALAHCLLCHSILPKTSGQDSPKGWGPAPYLLKGILLWEAWIRGWVKKKLRTFKSLPRTLMFFGDCYWFLWDLLRLLSESKSCSVVSDSATPWTTQSLEFFRPEYWNG